MRRKSVLPSDLKSGDVINVYTGVDPSIVFIQKLLTSKPDISIEIALTIVDVRPVSLGSTYDIKQRIGYVLETVEHGAVWIFAGALETIKVLP